MPGRFIPVWSQGTKSTVGGNVGVTLAVTRFAVSWLLSFQIPLLPPFLVCLKERFLVKIAHTDVDGLFLDQEQ